MKKFISLFICLILAASTSYGQSISSAKKVDFEILSVSSSPVIYQAHPNAADIKYGIEGGRVVKINGTYHLITTERSGDPIVVKTRLAYWNSKDGNHWQRVATLYESSGNYDGSDPRAALWGPMPTWDAKKNVWKLFYVAYRAKPSTAQSWYENYEGRIWEAISTKKGINGIGGPYKDAGVILQPADADKWEGLQGTDSFFAYQANHKWYGFYGSAQTETRPAKFHGVGLCEANTIDGPWKRISEKNPVDFKARFAENPVVTKLDNGLYVAMIDGGKNNFGYSVSADGLNWSEARFIDLSTKVKKWWSLMRTPLCLIKEPDNSYTVFFTCFPIAKSDMVPNFGSMGRANFKLIFN